MYSQRIASLSKIVHFSVQEPEPSNMEIVRAGYSQSFTSAGLLPSGGGPGTSHPAQDQSSIKAQALAGVTSKTLLFSMLAVDMVLTGVNSMKDMWNDFYRAKSCEIFCLYVL